MATKKEVIPPEQRQRLKTEADKAQEKSSQGKIVLSTDQLRAQIIAEAGYTASDLTPSTPWYIYAVGGAMIATSALIAWKL